MATADRKALNRWARDAGYSDFDTYIRAGNSILDARRDIAERIGTLQRSLTVLDSMSASHAKPLDPQTSQEIRTDLTERMEAFQNAHAALTPRDDETPDPANAHPQGGQA